MSSTKPTLKKFDVIIVGCGAAGLSCALNLDASYKIAIISKTTLDENSTMNAQGGIAAVVAKKDNIASHIADTLKTGGKLCKTKIVKFVINHAAEAVHWLITQGVRFTTCGKNTNFHLTREGGHSYRRVLHAADTTGKEIETVLLKQAQAQANITFFPEHTAID